MVTLTSADNALKTVYLDVLANQLNTKINPFLAKIKNTTKDVWGKEVIKLAPLGINGGISAGDENGDLPESAGNNYLKFTSTLKNLYGKISISDKAIRASSNNAGAFVSLLNDEMEGLVNAATFNFGRMIYGDGTGKLGTVSAVDSASNSFTVETGIKNFIEGQVVDLVGDTTSVTVRIKAIDRFNKKCYIVGAFASTPDGTITAYATDSKDKEITGLEKIFDNTSTIYGVSRTSDNFALCPTTDNATTTLSEVKMQEMIDNVEELNGSVIDFIACSSAVRRQYQAVLEANKRYVNTVELDGGVKALSFNGVPVVADRFCPEKHMYFLNTKSFNIHQLCDWRWLEGENGKILHQTPGKAAYDATLVKYCELICDLPGGQARFTNITE